MLTPALDRLIWKETRTLAPVWLALMAAVVAIQSLFVVFAWFDPTERWFDGRGLSWQTLLMVGMPLGFGYAAAAAGILFAGESEERTDDWLRVLPIPPRALTAAKLGVGIGTYLLFIAACAMCGGLGAMILTGWSGAVSVRGVDLLAALGFILLAGLAAMTTGVFLSVQMQRVIAVVVGTLISVVPLWGTADWFARDVLGVSSWFGFPLLFGGLALLDVWLVLRWCRGDTTAPNWSRLQQQCESAVGWAVPTRALEMALPARLVGTAHPTRWLLRRAATLGRPGLRGLAVLLWREARAAGRFSVIWITVGFICLLPAAVSRSRWGVVSVLWLLAGLYFVCTPGLCGLLAASGDRRRDQRLFLGHRGVSATTTWFAKQATWLSLACLLMLGWAWAQHELVQEFVRPNRVQPFAVVLTNTIHVPTLWHGHGQQPTTAADVSLRWHFALTLLLSLYAVGQLCGFWFRNAIVGGGLAIGWSMVVAAWLFLATAGDVPLWMSAGPLILLWLAASWRLMDDWLVDRRSRGLTLRRVGWMLAPCVAAVVMFSIARRTQIPWVEIDDNLNASVHRAAHRSWSQWRGDVSNRSRASTATLPAQPLEWPDLRQRLQDFVAPPGGRNGVMSPAELDASFSAFAESLRSGGFIASTPGTLVRTNWQQTVADYVTRRIERMPPVGARERELQLLVDGLTILREVRETPFDDYGALEERQTLFSQIAAWALSSDVTTDELQQAHASRALRLETGFIAWLEPAAYVAQMEELADRLYELTPGEWNELELISEVPPHILPWAWQVALTADQWLGERARTERFLRVCRNNAVAIANWDQPLEQFLADYSLVPRSDIERWAATTGPLRWAFGSRNPPFAELVLAVVQNLTLQGQTELACERGVQLLLALELFRREQGHYPNQLSQLVPQYLSQLPVDPFTGTEFEYFPHGLDAPWLLDARLAYSDATWSGYDPSPESSTSRQTRKQAASPYELRVIPAGQPLVYSRGPHHGGPVWQSDANPADRVAATRHTDASRTYGVYREVKNGLIDGGGPSSRTPPRSRRVANARAPAGAAPAFVVLGVDFAPWSVATVDVASTPTD